MAALKPQVVLLGLVSLLNDSASEMIYPLLPVFLISVLGATPVTVGVIEGAADGLASILKYFAGIDLGQAAAAQAAGGDRIRTGGGVARADRGGGTLAGGADGAADRSDGKRDPLRAARRDHRGRHAGRRPGPRLRFSARARPHGRGGRSAAGAAVSQRDSRPDADAVHDRGDSRRDRRGDA